MLVAAPIEAAFVNWRAVAGLAAGQDPHHPMSAATANSVRLQVPYS